MSPCSSRISLWTSSSITRESSWPKGCGPQRAHLHDLGDGTTHWVSENEYRFDSRVMRLLAPLMRGAFRKQTLAHM